MADYLPQRIVIKNKNKNNEGFEYEYDSPSFHKTIHQINPGEELMPLDQSGTFFPREVRASSVIKNANLMT